MKTGLIFIALLLKVTIGLSQTAVIDSLLTIVERHKGDTIEIKALEGLASEFMRKDLARAKGYSYQQIAVAQALHSDYGLPSAYAGLIAMHQNTGRLDSAQFYLNKLEMLAKKYPNNKRTGVNYANSMGLFYKNQGKYNEALPFLKEALRLMGTTGDATSRAGQMLNIGNTYYNMGSIKNAADYHLKSLALFEELNNQRGKSFCLQSLGSDFLALRQYSAAEKYFLQSEKLKEELGDKRGVITSWMNLGELYQQVNKPELSMLYSDKALTRARELKLTVEESRVLFNIGLLLKTTERSDEASEMFASALAIARQGGDSLFASKIKTEMVLLKSDLKKEKLEEHTLTQNIKISMEQGDRETTAEGYHKMATWYAAHKQFEKAYNSLNLSLQLNDSMRGTAVVGQLKKLEEQYKSDKKEKEIALLKKDQELHVLTLSRQRALTTATGIALISVLVIGLLVVNRYRVMNRSKRLIEIERVRNTIARDLHDDIGSALSSINILSKVAQVEHNGNTVDYLQRISDQSARMMENMSDMVWSINPRNDSLNQVSSHMREFAAEILDARNITYQFSENISSEISIDAEKRKNLFLIFKEAINNAAKYSCATQIEINLQQTDHTLSLKVKDNGLGFDEQTAKPGNGLRNLRERAKEARGTISVISEQGKGTEVNFKMPIA